MPVSIRDQREDDRWAENAAKVAEVTRALARSPTPEAARHAVCEGALKLADAQVAVVLEASPRDLILVASTALGADLKGTEIWIGDRASAAGRALRSGEEVLSGEAASADAERELLQRAGARSVVWYPIGRALVHPAVLAVAWHERVTAIPPRVGSMLDLLAASAEFAIGRADDERLRRLVRTDELTGLPNKRAFDEQLPRELSRARREGSALSLVLLDLDHFESYNERHGQVAGDQHLKRTAATWRHRLRPYDTLARSSGERFALILPGCDLRAAESVAERLRGLTPAGESCSAGVVEWGLNEHLEVFTARAEAALAEAKSAGRGRTIAAPRRGRAAAS